ncbi:MAG: endonuclease/exonuclease/phosphatase family protein [Acidimicrobiales bacterium]|nr:endonuclease/exonuclease/phosphatase family protein [Acidimicrobiales bacterium]
MTAAATDRSAADAPAAADPLRVMTWNLWWRFGPWEERASAIATVIAAESPDVVCLQEVWSLHGDSSAARLADTLGYHHVMTDDPFVGRRGEGGAGFHNAILSRAPLDDVGCHALPRSDGTPGHRRVLAARTTLRGHTWPVVCTHLEYRFDQSALRQAQAATVLRIVDEARGVPDRDPPAVVCGDFNAPPDSDEIRLLTGRAAAPVPGLVLSDAWEHVGEGAGLTWRGDNPYQAGSAWPNRRLDYVFVSWPRPKPLGNPVGAHLAGVGPVDGVVPSDHAAVVVDLHV